MQINATFGSGSTTQFESAVDSAISFFDHAFTNAVTLNINFNEAASSGFASSSAPLLNESYSAVSSALKALNQTADQSSAAAALPTSDPIGSTMQVSAAEAKALGLSLNGYTGADGTVNLNSSQPWAYSQANISLGQYDAVGAIEHEISEIMGRSAGSTGGILYNTPEAMHIFTGATSIINSAAATGTYLSLDGGKTNLGAIGEPNGGDIADWADPSNNSRDAFGYAYPGAPANISEADMREMNTLGWNYNQTNVSLNHDASGNLTSETVTAYSYGLATDTATIIFGANSATVAVNDTIDGTTQDYSIVGTPTVLLNVDGVTTTVSAGSSPNEIIIGGDSANVTGGAGQNLFLGLGVNDAFNAGSSGANTNQFALYGSLATVGANNSSVWFDDRVTGSVNGSSDTITANGGDQLAVTGAADSVTSTAAGDIITIGGNGNNTNVRDNVYFNGVGGTLLEVDNSFVSAYGSDVTANAGTNDSIGLVGSSDTTNVYGSGDTVYAGGNGNNTNVRDNVYFNGVGGTLAEVDNSFVAAYGSNVTANAGANDTIGLVGSSDTTNVNGGGDTVYAGGNGNNTNVRDNVYFNGVGGTLFAVDNSFVAAYGSNVTAIAGANDSIGLIGSSDTTNVNGGGDTVYAGGNGNNTNVRDNVYFNAVGGTLFTVDNSFVAAYGSNVTAIAGANDSIGLIGSSDTTNVNGSGDTVYAGGDGNNTNVRDNVYFKGVGGTLVEVDNSFVAAYGSNVTAIAGANDTIGLVGSSDTTNVNGSGDTVYAGGNGTNAANALDVINFNGVGGTLFEVDNSDVEVFGNSVWANIANYDTFVIYGSGDTINAPGVGDIIWQNGTKIR